MYLVVPHISFRFVCYCKVYIEIIFIGLFGLLNKLKKQSYQKSIFLENAAIDFFSNITSGNLEKHIITYPKIENGIFSKRF